MSNYFKIEKSTLFNILGIPSNGSIANNIIGWKIKFELQNLSPQTATHSQISFSELRIGSNQSIKHTLSPNHFDLVINGSAGQFIGANFRLDDFLSNQFNSYYDYNGDPFFFLNAKDLIYAGSQCSRFYFSPMIFDMSGSAINNQYSPLYLTLKVECEGGAFTIPYSSNTIPLVFFTVPCPPIWRPGYNLIKKEPISRRGSGL